MSPDAQAVTAGGRRWVLAASAVAALMLSILAISRVLDPVAFAVSWGMWVAVPLGLELAELPANRRRGLLAAWVPSALLGLASFLGDVGEAWVGGLGALYLMFCIAAALGGVDKLRGAPRDPAALCSSLGLLLLPVAGAWHLAERMGWTVLGFSGLWAGLTAAHFHFAGFGTPILLSVGLRRATSSRSHQWGEVVLLALGVLSVALGITFSPVLALLGTLCMVFPIWSYALRTLRYNAGSVLVRLLRGLSSVVPLATMSLALSWSLSVVLRLNWLDLNQMIRYHGLVNALGFISLGFAAECLQRDQAPRTPGVADT